MKSGTGIDLNGKMELISIIVPVYNAVQFLEDCIKSILSQTYQNIEVLLLDDGSTDNSYAICVSFQNQDDRIKAITKQNEGVSKTRNIGIEIAKGEYITFVDADDTIASNYIEELHKIIKKDNADIAFCRYCIKKGCKLFPPTERALPFYQSARDSLYDSYLVRFFGVAGADIVLGSSWRTMTKRELIEKHRIRFPSCRLAEDLLFVISILSYCQIATATDECLYYYNDAACDSATRQAYIKFMLEDKLLFENELLRRLNECNLAQTQIQTLYEYWVLTTKKALITNATAAPTKHTMKMELKAIRNSIFYKTKISKKIFFTWFRHLPFSSRFSEILILSHQYWIVTMLRKIIRVKRSKSFIISFL